MPLALAAILALALNSALLSAVLLILVRAQKPAPPAPQQRMPHPSAYPAFPPRPDDA